MLDGISLNQGSSIHPSSAQDVAREDAVQMRTKQASQTSLECGTTNVLLKTYVDPFKQREIRVLYRPETGLSSEIAFLGPQGQVMGTSSALPVRGVPERLMKEHDILRLTCFFEHTYLVPEKGVDGGYDRVSVHGCINGGTGGKIPFQPGIALGSIVRGETLAAMETYAAAIAKSESIEEQIGAAEQRIEQLESKIEARKKRVRDFKNDSLIAFWKGDKEATEGFIRLLGDALALEKVGSIPVFTGFYQSAESPIDPGKSKVEVQPRGFDSLHYSSEYLDMKQTVSELHDKVAHSSSSNSLSTQGGWWIFKGQGSHAWSDAVSTRLMQIKAGKKAEGVLMINAFATTRHVRCYTDLHFDKLKLRTTLDAMSRNNKAELEGYGITIAKDGSKAIYVLTEAVLGGSFTALVTFMNEEEMNRRVDKEVKEHSSSSSVSGGISPFLWNASVGYTRSSHKGTQTEDDVLNGIATTKVNIEIMSQGAMPTFTKSVIEREVFKHLNLDPSKFELSQQDESDLKASFSDKPLERIMANRKLELKMESSQLAVMNTVRGLASSKEEVHLHTPRNVMDAYESFASQMTTDKDCGVPVGFNYQVFSEERLREILKEIEGSEKKKKQEEASSVSGSASSNNNNNKSTKDEVN